jgi:oligopeptide/dipeptide ABC transporter ATP-binding protein
MTGPLLEVEDLRVTFRTGPHGSPLNVVRGVSFALEPGQRLGLVGESGCGKSTTILTLMGLLAPNAEVSGAIWLDGVDILQGGERSMRTHRWNDIAMVFQGAMNAFNPTHTIGTQIAETTRGRRGRKDRKAADSRARELLAMVGIQPDRADRYPHELSGGMRQRAALAMALASEPRILLADEPTTALDVMIQAQILELLETLTTELGLALILVTHDLPLVVETCDRVAMMYAGRLVEVGPAASLYNAAAHPYTRMLFAATPSLDLDRRVASLPGAPPRPDQELVGCDFAPRCDRAEVVCHLQSPRPTQVAEHHTAACHFADTGENHRMLTRVVR